MSILDLARDIAVKPRESAEKITASRPISGSASESSVVGISDDDRYSVLIGPQAFCKLLNLRHGKKQDPIGKYSGKLLEISHEYVCDHLAGRQTFAFSPIDGNNILFGGIDVDAEFPKRLPVFRNAIHTLGGDELERASFTTNGSSEGRGKIIITLASPCDNRAEQMRFLVEKIVEIASREEVFGPYTSADLKTVPQGGTGGLLRILGRNSSPVRAGALGIPCTLDGLITDLKNIVPLERNSLDNIYVSCLVERSHDGEAYEKHINESASQRLLVLQSPSCLPWCEKLLEMPWRRDECGGTRGAVLRSIAIAREAIRLYDSGDTGGNVFRGWLARIELNSPDYQRPSDKNKDKRNPLEWKYGGRRAWAIACKHPHSFVPMNALGVQQRDAAVVYKTLAEYVISNGLSSILFAMDYGRIAALCCIEDKRDAHRAVKRLVASGLLEIADPGTKHEVRKRGMISLFSIIGEGDTLESVRERRCATPRTFERLRKRALERDLYLSGEKSGVMVL